MNPIFHKEVFGIILTALFLTTFEIGFFVWQVAPTIGHNVKGLINIFANAIAKENPDLLQVPPSILAALEAEEADLTKRLNQSIIFDAAWVGVFLVILLWILAYALKGTGTSPMDKSSVLFLVGSLILFVAFQVFFFFEVSMAYGYPGNDESVFAAKKALLKAVKEAQKNSIVI